MHSGSGSAILSALTGPAVAIVIVALAILPFLSPAWVAFEQDRSQVEAWTGYSPDEVRQATNAILHDLVLGPPAFDVRVAGAPVLDERERSHMRDVRTVFAGFYALAGLSLVIALLAIRVLAPGPRWRAIGRGAVGLSVGVVVLGVVALVAFDALFEAFHRLFFAGGTYTFDTRTERLVQLFPDQFWQETALVVGAAIVVIGVLVALVARARSRDAEAAAKAPVGWTTRSATR